MRDTVPAILVIDDETETLKILRKNLEVRKYDVVTASSGLEALKVFDEGDFDLVLLDVFLPGIDGFKLCRLLREKSKSVGIIMMSARYVREKDKVEGLDFGADRYLCKPFGIEELLAHVNAVLRRTDNGVVIPSDKYFAFGDCEFHTVGRRLFFEDGDEVKLTPTEYAILDLLVANAGKAITHGALLKSIWGLEYLNDRQYLWTYILRLRRKLRDDATDPHLLFSQPSTSSIWN